MELSFLFLLALFAPLHRTQAASEDIRFMPIPNYVRTIGGTTDGSLSRPTIEYAVGHRSAPPPAIGLI